MRKRLTSTTLRASAVLMLIALMSSLMSPAHAGSKDSQRRTVLNWTGATVTAMSRNVYLGADINRPITAALTAEATGGTPQDVLVALANGTHETREIVDRTNFNVRAGLLADEIAKKRPTFVGLQEVALWRSGPLQLDQVAVPNAETVDYDYLEILLQALEAKGADYRAVKVSQRADVEAPSFTGSPFDQTIGGNVRDVRLTTRDVILVRDQRHLRVRNSGDAIYENNLELDLLGSSLNFDRGYQWIDARVGFRKVRFVNTHLEAFSADLALAQAGEVVEKAAPTDRGVIFVCDCNSDPLNDSVPANSSVPQNSAYNLITGEGGFADQWLRRSRGDGFTSGLSETVDDATADGFRKRIDMVFVRSSRGRGAPVLRAAVTGDEVSDRDPETGLWPSDHGGVVVKMWLGRSWWR